MTKRVLVVGGAGTFGRLLVRGLAATTDYEIVLGGRDAARADALANELREDWPGRSFATTAIDRNTVTPEALRRLGIFAVADTAGPFQGADLSLAEATVEAGIHYVDLADARDFVAAFPRLDAKAKERSVTALTGASSTPALSHAVLDHLTRGWRAIDSVEIAISPGNRAPRGLSVVAAILSYAGRPVRVFLDGGWQTRPGWGMLAPRTFAGLGRRWLSICDTPDLDLVPARFSVRHAAIFRAGLELPVLHLGLSAASMLVRARLIGSLRPFAALFRGAAGLLSGFGTDRGGMLVEASGTAADGRRVVARWTLVAEAGDGPVIPTLPALAALRCLAQASLAPGASACAGVLALEEIEAEFRSYRIHTLVDVSHPDGGLFERALGAGFAIMPAPIRAAHTVESRPVLQGEADVTGAENAAGRLIAALFRLPQRGERVPVTVTMEARNGREVWTRDFGGRRFRSVLAARPGGGLSERFGPLTFDLDVPASQAGLDMLVTGWRLGPIPLPRRLAPATDARERIDTEGRFSFDVAIALPLIGRLVRYRGWLVPAALRETYGQIGEPGLQENDAGPLGGSGRVVS